MRTTDVTEFWNALGSFWGDFEDKELINEIWWGYYHLFSGMNQKSLDLRNSIGFQNMPGVIEDRHHSFDIIYSVNSPEYSGLINAYTVSGTEGFRYEYNLEPGTISIPTLEYYYYSDSGTLSSLQTMTEGTDYYILDMERLRFTGSPPFTINQNQTHLNGQQLYADLIYRVNPALWGVETKKVGLDETALTDHKYNAFVSGYSYSGVLRDRVDADHFKYLVWALQEGVGRKPTLTNIDHLYGLLRGLPFAHNSGVLSSGIIGDNVNTYPISGYYNLRFINSGYITTDRPMFYENDYQIDIVARFNEIPVENQYLLSVSGSWSSPSTGYQSMKIFYDADNSNIKYEVKGTKELNPSFALQGIVYEMPDSNLNIHDWNKYSIRKTGGKTFEFYLNDQLLQEEDTLASPDWQSSPTSDYKLVIGAQYTYDGTTEALVGGDTGLSNVNIAQVRYSTNNSGVTFHTYMVPDENLSPVAVTDVSSSGYAISISGTNEWQQVEMPMVGYTHLSAESEIPQFTLLISGTNVYDHVNNYSQISGLIDFEVERYRHITIADSGLQFRGHWQWDQDYLETILDQYIPSHISYGINENIYSGIFMATWGNDANDGSRQKPFRTFEAAAPNIPEGGTLWIRKGSYDQFFRSSLLNHSGISWDAPLRVKAFPGEHVKLVNSANSGSGIVCFDRSAPSNYQYLSFEDFEIDGQGVSRPLVKISQGGVCHGIQLYNCYFHGNNSDDVDQYDVFSRGNQNRIKRCRFAAEGGYVGHKAIQVEANNAANYTNADSEYSYNLISGYAYGIHINVDDTKHTYLRRARPHHNYIKNCKVGIHSCSDRTYAYTNLIENCNRGIEIGTTRQDFRGVYANNTIKNIKVSGVWGTGDSAIGIVCGSGNYTHATNGNRSFCVSGHILNNVITECDDYTFYDPSGVADSNNFYTIQEYNLEDSNNLPKTGFTYASTNINSGTVFYYKFRTAEEDKDYKLHPYFSSGYKQGATLLAYSGIFTDLELDYSGVARTATYSGWDLGAYETVV